MDAMALPAAPHSSIEARLLPQIIEAYLRTIEETGAVKRQTAVSYRQQLKPWLAFWDSCAQIHNYTLSRAILAQALHWIETEYRTQRFDRPLSAMGVYDCFNRLKQVFHWAYRNNATGTIDVAEWCPPLKQPDTPQYFPRPEEIEALLAAPTGIERLRDVACMAFMLSTAARRLETALALVENIEFQTAITNLMVGDDHRGWIHLRHVKGDMTGRGEGRAVVFCSKAGLLLKCYLRAANITEGPIFRITDSGIGLMIRRHTEACGLARISPHALRRMFADTFDEVHGDNGRRVLKKQLGHGLKGDITDRYIRRNLRRTAKQIMEMHVSPLDSIELDWETFPVHIT